MKPVEVDWYFRFGEFLKNRKKSRGEAKTAQQAFSIMMLLQLYRRMVSDEEKAWVRSKELLAALKKSSDEIGPIHASTFYRLLDDLEKYRFIERRGKEMTPHRPGRVPVYYRIQGDHTIIPKITKGDLQTQIFEVNMDLHAAKSLLIKCHENSPGYFVEHEIAQEKKRLFSGN